MCELSKVLHLLDDFPPVSTEIWDSAIQIDLKGADYNKKLLWNTDEGIVVRPYFRREDTQNLEPHVEPIAGAFPFVRGRGSQSWEQVESPAVLPADAVRADTIHDQGGTVVQELGYGIALGVEKLIEKLEEGQGVDEAAAGIQFVFAIGSNYFFEIAKLRAARLLWAHAVWAFQPQKEVSCLMQIHVCTA